MLLHCAGRRHFGAFLPVVHCSCLPLTALLCLPLTALLGLLASHRPYGMMVLAEARVRAIGPQLGGRQVTGHEPC